MKLLRKFFNALLRPVMGIDSDSDLLDVKNTRVLDALNTTVISDGGSTGLRREPVKGSEFAFKPEQVVAQNRIIRITAFCEVQGVYCFDVLDGNGQLIFRTANVIATVGDSTTTILDISTALDDGFVANSLTYNVAGGGVVSVNEAYIDIEITGIPTWGYTIVQQEFGVDDILNPDITGPGGAAAPDWTEESGATITWSPIQVEFFPVIAAATAVVSADTNPLLLNYDYKYNAFVTISSGSGSFYLGATTSPNKGTIDFEDEVDDICEGIIRTDTAVDKLFLSAGSAIATTNAIISYAHLYPRLAQATIEIIQDPIDGSMTGIWEDIASVDYQGKLFVWYANTKEPERKLEVTIADNGSGVVRATTLEEHGMTAQQQVVISGTGLNDGAWIVDVINLYDFDLLGSIYSADGAGFATIGSRALGEIGVAEKNDFTGVWTYTRLVRALFNFRLVWQIDAEVEDDALGYSFYWVDHNNFDRTLRYVGAFVQDGAITAVNPEGLYSYGTILQETFLMTGSTSGVRLNFVEQKDTGGNISPGNHYYTVILLSESLTESQPLTIVGPINAGEGSISVPQEVHGSEPSAISTTRSNIFELTGLPLGVYKYAELVDICYSGSDVLGVGQIVSRTLIPEGSTSMQLLHSGFENNIRDFDVGLLAKIPSPYVISKSIAIVDKSLIRTNVKTAADLDLTDFFKTFKHTLFREELDSVGISGNRFGEYQNPLNVCYKGGFMFFECYRFYGRVEYINGGFSESFWVDDILINTEDFNIDVAYTDNRREANTGPSKIVSYDLTDDDARFVYVPAVSFHGFDTKYSINGLPLDQVVKAIHIECVELDDQTREVLSSGMAVMGVSGYARGNSAIAADSWLYYEGAASPPVNPNPTIGPFPFVSGGLNDATYSAGGFSDVNPTYGLQNGYLDDRFTQERRSLFYMSPDVEFNEHLYTKNSPGDQIICLGSPYRVGVVEVSYAGAIQTGKYTEFNGVTGRAGSLAVSRFDIKKGVRMTSNRETLDTLVEHTTILIRYDILNVGFLTMITAWDHTPVVAIRAEDLVTDDNHGEILTTPNDDCGAYFSYYYRKKGPVYDASYNPDTSKFGDRKSTKHYSINSIYEVISALQTTTTFIVPALEFKTYGKDVFTQKTFIRNRVPASFGGTSTVTITAANIELAAFASGIAYYSQNRVNAQMVQRNAPLNSNYAHPRASLTLWFFGHDQVISNNGSVAYNRGYNNETPIVAQYPFNPLSTQITHFKTRTVYSDPKNIGSLVDSYRIHRPFNYKDLDYKYGEIVDHFELENQLMILQRGAWRREFFNSKRMLQTANGAEIIVGDGEALSQRGDILTYLGTTHKWSRVKGRTKAGKEVAYWINADFQCVLRFGADGSVNISSEHETRAFFEKYLSLMKDKDRPSYGQGISGVWNDERREVIWTIRGKADIDAWDEFSTYDIGEEVSYDGNLTTYHQTGEIYISLVEPNLGVEPGTDADVWQLVPHTDTKYYNEVTIAFSEETNDFNTRYSFMPKRFMQWRKRFLSARPVDDVSEAYEHNRGQYCRWWDRLEENGHVEMISNIEPSNSKSYRALWVKSAIVPFRTEFTTSRHISYLNASEFEANEDSFACEIKEDSTVTGLNEGDTDTLFGDYLKVKFIFEKLIYQSLRSVEVRQMLRPPNNKS